LNYARHDESKNRNESDGYGMAENKDARGYDIFINGLKRSHRDELAIAEEAVRYFRRNASNAGVTLFDRKKKAFLLVDGA
jgi:hypothetical protein